MGALDAAVRADTLLPNPRTFPTVEVQIPGETQRWAEVETGSLCEPTARWAGRILDLGPHSASANHPECSMEFDETDCVVEDQDRTLGALLERADAMGAPVFVRLITAHPTSPPRSTTQTAVLFAARREGDLAMRLTFRPVTDKPLQSPPNKLAIDLSLLPFAGPDALGLPIPLLYGYHVSWGLGGQGEGGGAIAPIYVGQYGSNDFRWLLCLARNREVYRALSNAVTLPTSQWSHIVETDRGVTLSFVSTTTDLSGGTLTCDVAGYDFVGDGTGAVINEVPDVLQHIVHHFSGYSFAPYQSGNWYTGWETHDGLLDLAYRNTLRTFLRKRLYCYPRLSRYLSEKSKTLGAYIDEICKTAQVYPFWLETGKLAIAGDDVDTYDYISTHPEWLDWRKYELRDHPFTPVTEGLQTAKRIFVSYSNINGAFQGSLEVFSPLAAEESAEDLEMAWGPAVS